MNLTLTTWYIFLFFKFHFILGQETRDSGEVVDANSIILHRMLFSMLKGKYPVVNGQIRDSCSKSNECNYTNSKCRGGFCVCNLPNPVIDHIGHRCLPVAYEENDACEINSQCHLSKLYCIENKCQKRRNFFKNNLYLQLFTCLSLFVIVLAILLSCHCLRKNTCRRSQNQLCNYSPVDPSIFERNEIVKPPSYEEAVRQNV